MTLHFLERVNSSIFSFWLWPKRCWTINNNIFSCFKFKGKAIYFLKHVAVCHATFQCKNFFCFTLFNLINAVYYWVAILNSPEGLDCWPYFFFIFNNFPVFYKITSRSIFRELLNTIYWRSYNETEIIWIFMHFWNTMHYR